MYIKIVDQPIHPEEVIFQARTNNSGCVVTYVGLIRDTSHDKPVRSVEYRDTDGKATQRLQELAEEIQEKFKINNIAICHRTGILRVGEINLVFAFAAAHRQEGFAACEFAIDKFKDSMPTQKKETYIDGSINTEW
jgi:molybdopterin synthase catalytic subunit